MARLLRVNVIGDRQTRAGLRRAASRLERPGPALERAAEAVARTASVLAAKRTGKLSRNNKPKVYARSAWVRNRTKYAWYQEHGTRVMNAHPFLRPALDQTPIERIFADYVDDVANDI